MNQQERDELRAKHRRNGVLGCWTCQDYSWNDDYPCDVIKVLDAWEATLGYVRYASTHITLDDTLRRDLEVIGNGEVPGFAQTHTAEYPSEGQNAERTNGSVILAAMDTVDTDTVHADTPKYPPEGQNAECDHPMHRHWLPGDPSRCPNCGEKL